MMTRLSLAEAKTKLAGVVADVQRNGTRYLLVRRGKPVAAIVNAGDLELLDSTPPLHAAAGALALVGRWADVDDAAIDEFVRDIYESRRNDPARAIDFADPLAT
jgi:prevent-host-death family protein